MGSATVQIWPYIAKGMSILGGEGFSLPIVNDVEVVEASITFTDTANTAVSQAIKGEEDTHVLIISAQSGGCSGYLYDMRIIEDPGREGFQEFNVGNATVLVHKKDSALLDGIEVDYKDTLMGGGFQITNPNADRSCGCGQSFG